MLNFWYPGSDNFYAYPSIYLMFLSPLLFAAELSLCAEIYKLTYSCTSVSVQFTLSFYFIYACLLYSPTLYAPLFIFTALSRWTVQLAPLSSYEPLFLSSSFVHNSFPKQYHCVFIVMLISWTSVLHPFYYSRTCSVPGIAKSYYSHSTSKSRYFKLLLR